MTMITLDKLSPTVGAEVVQEPKSQAWGVTDCAFRDPSGTMVRLTQA